MTKSATIKSAMPMSTSAQPKTAKTRFSRNTKIVIGACAAILVFGGLIIAGMPQPASNGPKAGQSLPSAPAVPSGALRARETNFNFGSISMAAGKVTHLYRFRNASAQPVVLEKMYTSCMCTTAALIKSNGRKFAPVGMPGHTPIPALNETLQPNEEAMVEVVFDPAAHGPAGVGPIDRVVTLENSAGQPLDLAFVAIVTP